MAYDGNSSKIKSITKLDSTPEGRYGRWRDEITMAKKEFDNFRRQGRTTVRRYKDERDAVDSSERKFNIFTANVEHPAVQPLLQDPQGDGQPALRAVRWTTRPGWPR